MVMLRVVLVEPKHPGNVGAVARLCGNFGVDQLHLVNAPPLEDVAEKRAMHALELLRAAPRHRSLEQALQGVDFVVGTTAKIPRSDKQHLRNPVDAADLPGRMADRAGTVALLFGRENFGLLTPELERCDMTVTIPTDAGFRSLNLSHAVAVVLHEFYSEAMQGPFKPLRQMDGQMRDAFYSMMDQYIESLGLANHKVIISKRVVRKLFGRAVPSSWEFFVVMGLFRRGLQRMNPSDVEPMGDIDVDVPEGWQDELRELLGGDVLE